MNQNFTAFIDRLYPYLNRQAYRIAESIPFLRLDIEDLIQEARIAIWRHWPLENAITVEALALTISRYAMIAFLRTQLRQSAEAVSLEAMIYEGETEEMQVALPDRPNTHRLATPAQRRVILAALDRLKPNQRIAILALFAIEDRRGRVLSPDEAERRLSGSFRHHKSNGLRRLRQVLLAERQVQA